MLFMFMAVWWFITTLNGLSTIIRKNVLAHKLWMIRSYAMALDGRNVSYLSHPFLPPGMGSFEKL
ncbi:MAG: DUF2306 domain-containing protein [Chitinophagaceae bacterium]|nr:DUF2306 domain-containing protein [Chitinophagaceae bacterium]